MEFGDKRPEYDVAFVYYAGHGVQVGENYLLPTKVDFQKETDVRMKAFRSRYYDVFNKYDKSG